MQSAEKETPRILAALDGHFDFMNWIILIVVGLCEVGFTYCLGRAKAVDGLQWWAWMAGFIAFTVLSMALLAKATQMLPIGTGYTVRTGIGAVGTVLVGILFFNEPAILETRFHHYVDFVDSRLKNRLISAQKRKTHLLRI